MRISLGLFSLLLGLAGCDDAPDAAAAVDAAPATPCEADHRRPCPDGCADAWQICVAGEWGPCEAPPERCDGVDQDCDGIVDEGLTAACDVGVAVCVDGAWTRCPEAAEPPARDEICDGRDNDRDGAVDEGPLISARGRLPAPASESVSALFWQDGAWALVLPAYPSWLISLSMEGPVVWGSRRFGEGRARAAGALNRAGLALAWRDTGRALTYTLLDESGAVRRPAGPVGAFEVSSGMPWIDAEQAQVALAWLQAGRAQVALIEPVSAEVQAHAELGQAVETQVVSVGEDGFFVGWRTPRAQATVARLGADLEVLAGPVEVATAQAIAISGNPYREQVMVGWLADDAVHAQRFDRALAPIGPPLILAADQTGASDLKLVRNEGDYAFFWSAEAGEARVLRAAALSDDGEIRVAPLDLATVTGDFVLGRAGADFGLAWRDDTHVHLLRTPLRCPAEID